MLRIGTLGKANSHISRTRVIHQRPQQEEEHRSDKAPAHNGEEHAETRPFSTRRLSVSIAVPDVASHNDQVCRQDGDATERIDGIERSVGSDIDERDERDDADGRKDGMDRDIEAFAHLRQPARCWEAAVAGETPHLARRAGTLGNRGRDHLNGYYGNHHAGAGFAAHRIVQNLDEGCPNWSVQHTFQIDDRADVGPAKRNSHGHLITRGMMREAF